MTLLRMVGFGRGMQGRHLAYWALAVITVIFVLNHMLSEITRLDTARIQLEQTLAKIQTEQGENGKSRRVPFSYEQEPDPLNEFDDELVVIYNRVPKTGSTSFAGIAYDLCTRNKFNVLHFNITRNNHVLSVADQMRFLNNITSWDAKKPALYHGHVAYIEVSRFGLKTKPLFINIIRDPLDRLVSYYYFLRHGDDFRPHLKRRRSGNKQTFDECVANDGSDCDPDNLWLQIPFFCGHAADCWIPGNKWALEMAKFNLVNNYLVVGLTEELGDFIAVVEATLPRFFTGATELFETGRKSHLRKTSNKVLPATETIAKIQQSEIWKMEQNFYEFTRDHFHFMKKKVYELQDSVPQGGLKTQFMYEKIRPR